jgi:hypothetical protein
MYLRKKRSSRRRVSCATLEIVFLLFSLFFFPFSTRTTLGKNSSNVGRRRGNNKPCRRARRAPKGWQLSSHTPLRRDNRDRKEEEEIEKPAFAKKKKKLSQMM